MTKIRDAWILARCVVAYVLMRLTLAVLPAGCRDRFSAGVREAFPPL